MSHHSIQIQVSCIIENESPLILIMKAPTMMTTMLVIVWIVRTASMVFNCYQMRDRQCVGVDREALIIIKADPIEN